MQWVNRLWYSKRKLNWGVMTPLILLAGLYALIVQGRKFLYQWRIKSISKFPVPVIVVGNITVGGTGKTPLVVWLVKYLQEQGYHPGIVSRGYGGKAKQWPLTVTPESCPLQVGDEPLLLKLQTGCPVVVGPKRVAAAKQLLLNNTCDVIISDDGLQHYALARDIEIAVIDGERRLGNGYYLPLGPLRESRRRLAMVDYIVCNGEPQLDEFAMQVRGHSFISIQDSSKILTAAELLESRIIAIAAIGNPKRFFKTLASMGLQFDKRIFPDHHHYSQRDFEFASPDAVIIMTEKDAVKCRGFADKRFYWLPITVTLPNAFSVQLLEQLQALSNAKMS